MFMLTLAITGFAASTAFATPLLGSLWGNSQSDALPKDRPSVRLTRRDVKGVELPQLPTCHQDTLYELFIDPENAVAASAFCSVYIASSSLVRATVTPTYTTTVSVMTAEDVQITTGTEYPSTSSETCSPDHEDDDADGDGDDDDDNDEDDSADSDTDRPALVTPTVMLKPERRSDASVPPLQAGSFPSLRLSSACSCLVLPSTIVTTLTATAPAEYSTEKYTVQATDRTRADNVTSAGSRQSTANITTTAPPFPTRSVNDTATISLSVNGTAVTRTISLISLTSGTMATSNSTFIASTPSNTTAAPSASRNGTATAGIPGSTGTSNSSGPAAYCSETFVRGNGTFLARYRVLCAYSFSNLTPIRIESRSSWGVCVQECDNDSRCYGFSYLLEADTENCYIYNYYPLPSGHPDDLFDSGSYVVGSNDGMKR